MVYFHVQCVEIILELWVARCVTDLTLTINQCNQLYVAPHDFCHPNSIGEVRNLFQKFVNK